jgi:phosphate butyryltransferase
MKLVSIFLILIITQILCEKKVTFEKLLSDLRKDIKMKKIAIAGADNPETLMTSRIAKNMEIGDSILIGDEKKIRQIAEEYDVDISDFEIVDLQTPTEISRYAVKLVHDRKADMYVKGNIETRDVLKAVLDKEIGLKTNNLISMVGVFEIEDRMIFLTDPSVMPYPTLDEKAQLINNAVNFARFAGIKEPKVAAVTAISVSNPRMPETMDAEQLTKMNKEGIIKNCIVDGPLSLDLAISPESAQIKNSQRRINGDADIILFPDVHAANIAYKILTHLSDAKSGNIILGTAEPVILSSRSDTVQVKLNSIILGFTYDRLIHQLNKEGK